MRPILIPTDFIRSKGRDQREKSPMRRRFNSLLRACGLSPDSSRAPGRTFEAGPRPVDEAAETETTKHTIAHLSARRTNARVPYRSTANGLRVDQALKRSLRSIGRRVQSGIARRERAIRMRAPGSRKLNQTETPGLWRSVRTRRESETRAEEGQCRPRRFQSHDGEWTESGCISF